MRAASRKSFSTWLFAVEYFFDLRQEGRPGAGAARFALPFAGKLAENLLRFGQIVFSSRLVMRFLTIQCNGFAHDLLVTYSRDYFKLFPRCKKFKNSTCQSAGA